MKHSALRKDILREIKKSFGRFISIFAIVAIGVAFFAGVNASVPVMKGSADQYYDRTNFMDVKLMSSIGITKDDVEAIRKVEGVEGVYASHSMDALSLKDNDQKVVKVMSMPLQADITDANVINQPYLVSGRLPKKEDECVIENGKITSSHYKIGDTISLFSGSEEAISKELKRTSFTIVGTVNSPLYLSYEKGSSTIGSGKINTYIMIADQVFTAAYYSELYVTIEGAKAENAYSDRYFEIVDAVKENLTTVGNAQITTRFNTLKQEALTKLKDARTTYETSVTSFQQEIQQAKQALKEGQEEATQAQQTLDAHRQEIEEALAQQADTLAKSEQQIATTQTQYDTEYAKLVSKKKLYEETLPTLHQQMKDMKTSIAQCDTQINQLDQQLQDASLSEATRQLLTKARTDLVKTKKQTQQTLTTLEEQRTTTANQISAGEEKLAEVANQIHEAKIKLETGKKQWEKAKITAQEQLQTSQQQIEDAKHKLEIAQTSLDTQEREGKAKLAEAKAKIEKNETDVGAMSDPTWYTLDRHSHYSYVDYGSAADRMGGIAKVFPVFFFLVAALVCLTTMTRMVDEQRQEIGTLKALGYTKGYIALKYIAYAGIASVLGGIFGAIIGMSLFPTVIYNAWNIMYTLPSVHLSFEGGLAIASIAIVSSITILAAIAAVYKELLEVPSQLMRPKAPKNGKKILLERVPWIWKRFSFIYKVTARNIFRYKKRFFMTVIGISGCTALLLAGFGIQDSIGDIALLQYETIYRYDVSMDFESDASNREKEQLLTELKEDGRIANATAIGVYNATFEDDTGITIYVPSELGTFQDYVTLRTRVAHHDLTLDDEGAIITEKIAKAKGIAVGDHIQIDNGEGTFQDVRIAGICENYIGHALYMTPAYYKSLYHTEVSNSELLGIMKTSDQANEQALGKVFMDKEQISSIYFYRGIAENFMETISSLSFVVIVLIISAGILAFVVLYNLTNVNISERLREIATIKVLGFYDKEVSSYVYRENIFLTLIGALCGLALGIVLHSMIMSLAEMDTIMFGRNIYIQSFVYSVAITMGFSILVNMVMYRKLKRIPMVESLKSIE